MNDKDLSSFRDAMQDVTPLAPDDHHLEPPKQQQPSLAQLARRQAACEQPSDDNPLSPPQELAPCDPHDIAGHRKNGVQEGVYRKLRLGKYAPQASIDLHRLTLKEARQRLDSFLKQAHGQQLRTLLVNHGKGEKALLKSHTWFWLDQHPLVLAWHSAIPRQGGAGATYVLIRKSSLG